MAIKQLRDLAPVYLIWSKEDLLLEQGVARLRARVAQHADLDFNLDVFDGETASVDAVLAAADTLPFASEKRLVVVRGVDKMNAAAQNALAAYAADPAETTCLVLVASKVSRASKLFKAVDALHGAAEYRAPRRNDYPSWVVAQFASKGRTLSMDGAAALVRAVGRDLRRLDAEADKIIAFAGGKERLSESDVTAVVSQTAPASVFDLCDAMGARQAAAALGTLGDLLDAGESVLGVHAMAVRHLRLLLSVRALLDRDADAHAIGREIGAQDWQVRNYIAQARRFDEHALIEDLRTAALAEERMKTSQGEPRLVFERWLVAVCER